MNKRLRSSLLPFDWKKGMLRGKSAETDKCHPDRKQLQVQKVTTISLHESILERCRKRGDMWALWVRDRLYGYINLVAAEAIYHDNCFSWFMLNKQFDTAAKHTQLKTKKGNI